MKLSVITIATHYDAYLAPLEEIAKKKGIVIEIIGLGQKWQGFTWITELAMNHIKEHHNDPDDIVMIIDGFDVLLLGSPDEILEKYKSFNKDIVFSTEIPQSQPNPNYIVNIVYPFTKYFVFGMRTNNPMINAGCTIGRGPQMARLLGDILKMSKRINSTDNQVCLNQVDLSSYSHAYDFDSKIFWIWGATSVKELLSMGVMTSSLPEMYSGCTVDDTGRVVFDKKINNENIKPCVVHGVAQRDMRYLCKKNGVNVDHKKRVYSQLLTVNWLSFVKKILLFLFIAVALYVAWYTIPSMMETVDVITEAEQEFLNSLM
ncbi:hypothetical protein YASMINEVIRUS_24 [Yasminevirus sp. GU-2018]|uniref:PLOD1-3-like GT domain-containing protein n=1 Tax=Yasminevirus sp. GU-2018 TaxID=2420051 RepID=A0A5K0U857_9VIRU|nr:hypothetical protein YASMINEVIRUS_24 [Yasminevirus sp. GU-2018]